MLFALVPLEQFGHGQGLGFNQLGGAWVSGPQGSYQGHKVLLLLQILALKSPNSPEMPCSSARTPTHLAATNNVPLSLRPSRPLPVIFHSVASLLSVSIPACLAS